MKNRIKYFVFTALATLFFDSAATTWAEIKVIDPISGAECTVQAPASSGSYIYDLPSKYDGVFWPFTEFTWLWYCPQSGYVSFGSDFEELTESEKARISNFLRQAKPLLPDQPSMMTRLWLADQIYALRDKDAEWKAWYQRVRARLLDKIASTSRQNAASLLQETLPQRGMEAQLVIDRLVLARYLSCFTFGGDGTLELETARKDISENADELGKNAVKYLDNLANDISQEMTGCHSSGH